MMKRGIFIAVVLGMFLGFIFITVASLTAQQVKKPAAPEPPPPPAVESTPKFIIIHAVRAESDADKVSTEKFGKSEFLPALKSLQPKGLLGVYLIKGSQLKFEDDEYEAPANLGLVELWDSAENATSFWKKPPQKIADLMNKKGIASGPLEHKYSFYDVVE
jgi:hypothetical protein